MCSYRSLCLDMQGVMYDTEHLPAATTLMLVTLKTTGVSGRFAHAT